MSHLAGGVFPPPPAVAELISKLPPPSSYEVRIAIYQHYKYQGLAYTVVEFSSIG